MAKKETDPMTDAQMDSASEQTGAELKRGKTVRIKIPIDPMNKSDKVVPVCINGHLYRINRGESVEVPEAVAEVLEQGGYI